MAANLSRVPSIQHIALPPPRDRPETELLKKFGASTFARDIANGAEVNAKSDLGRTPLDWAEEWKNTKTVEKLLNHGARR